MRATKSEKESAAKAPYAFFRPFEPVAGELVINKELASGLLRHTAVSTLRKMGVESPSSARKSTPGCVRATVWEG